MSTSSSKYTHEQLVMSESDIRRYYSFCVADLDTGCWNWSGVKTRKGRGMLYMASVNTMILAYTLAYHTFIGDVPIGHELAHTYNKVLEGHCKCAFWEHVRPLTVRENALEAKGRTILLCPQGHDRRWGQTYPTGQCKVCNRLNSQRYLSIKLGCSACGYRSCRCSNPPWKEESWL